MLIPGYFVSIITFPGVIVHECAHRFFADWSKVPVYKVCYFRIGNPAGYVVHGPVNSLKDSLLISAGPLIINTLLCAIINFSAIFPVFILEATEYDGIFFFLAYIGFSIGMHAFPSHEDMENLLAQVKNIRQHGLLRWAIKLFAMFLQLANALRVLWFDVIYAGLVSLALPWMFGLL